MTEIKQGGYVFSVDREKTEEDYKNNASYACGCDGCRLLSSEIKKRFPKLAEFLRQFGIDAENFDEAGPAELDGEYLYTLIGYTVCGKITEKPSEVCAVYDSDGITVEAEEGFAFPNMQSGEHFSLLVSGVIIPCAEASLKQKKNDCPENFLKRIFKKR